MNTETFYQIARDSVSFLRDKKIFVTGGTGFFGKSLLDFLGTYASEINFDMVILSRNPDQFLKLNPQFLTLKKVRFLKGDITDFEFVNEKFNFILHFATPADAKLNLQQPLLMADIISRGMQRCLDFAVHTGCQKLLFASSGAVYGPQPSELTHIPETYLGSPQTTATDAAYGESKRYAEMIGAATAIKHKFEFKIARCFAFVGPHLDRHGSFAISNFIQNALDNQAITINGDGTPFRSYLYADDLMIWLLRILDAGRPNEAYNVGSDQDLSIKALAEVVAKNLRPQLNVNVAKAPSEKPPTRYVPSIQKAKVDLALNVWTSLDEAIRRSAL